MSQELTLSELPTIHGAMAEFDTPEELLRAGERAFAAGYRRMDAYAPMPVAGLAETIGYKRNKVAFCVLIGGICGAMFGFGLLEWMTMVAYAHNVGGRPTNSWPAYIPITFECMILFASLTALVSMLAMNGLPKPYHPVFNVAAFDRASIDKFFLCIESSDPKFRVEDTLQFLRDTGAREVSVVPA
jgi:Alternative complex III, ActD subunit